MSGLAGIYHFDGGPVDPSALGRMIDAIAQRGPDGRGAWCRGSIGLGHRLLRTTPESLDERQPLEDEDGTVCLTMDGRVDNREELRETLQRDGVRFRDNTDAELVLRAYQCHGLECPALILGDFALAIWDIRVRRLMFARDPLGLRPLYYAMTPAAILWGSQIKQLFASRFVQPEPNPGVVGEYLSYRPTHLEETLYQGVHRLPPGHFLTVEDGRPGLVRFFHLDPRREIRYQRQTEYAEHFYEIFERSVKCRLRAVGPVSVFLSGGLDSSAIAGMTQAIARRHPGATPGVNLLSLTPSHPAAAELQYAEAVGRQWRLPLAMMSPEGFRPPPLADQVRAEQDFPDAPNTSPWGLLLDCVRAAGGRVVLWGHGGDEWLTGDSTHCADMLARFEIAAALRQMRLDLKLSKLWGGGTVRFVDLLQWAVFPLVPRPVRRIARPFVGRRVPRWISADFAGKIDLAGRLRNGHAPIPGFPTSAQRATAAQIDGGWAVIERELLDRFGGGFSTEQRFPFHDRRLIEFALAIPEDQRWRGDETKFVLRQAARTLIPELVRSRRTKADFSYLFAEMFERERSGDVFGSLRLVDDGYLDRSEVGKVYDRFRAGARADLDIVWMILALENWYRVMFQRRTE